MENTIGLMMRLIRSVLSKEAGEIGEIELTREEGENLFRLAKMHDMAHFVGYAMKREGVKAPEDILERFSQEQALAIYRYEQQNYEFEQICEAFESGGIEFIPLKGSVIRTLYPEPWLRTSCDIDILVREEDLERASIFLEKELQYERGKFGPHELTMYTPSGVCFELHYDLIEIYDFEEGRFPLQGIWEKTKIVEGKRYQQEISKELFYYYHIAHMAKHFKYGGCGIRPFLDIYILNHFTILNGKEKETLLEKGRLLDFTRQAINLSEIWFGNREHNGVTLQMEEYLLKAGVYGSYDNKIAVREVQSGGKNKYIRSRIWLPFEQLKVQYPKLEKRKWLTPVYQFRRWCRLIFCGRMKQSMKELKTVNAVTEEKQKAMEKMLQALGLQ